MNKVKGLFLALAIVFISLITVACKNNIENIDASVYLVARRDKITINADFYDPEKRIFNGITPSASVYSTTEDEELIETKSFSIKNGTNPDINTEASELQFTDLEKEKNYVVKILITVDGYESVLFEQTVTTTLDGSDEEHAISITTIDEFRAIKNDREGYFKLEADLDFENDTLEPMFTTESQAFTGNFNGNGHTIKNLKIDGSYQYMGLFGYNKGVIKNLTLDNIELSTKRSSDTNIGFISGVNTKEITNCTVKNSKLKAESSTFSRVVDFNVGGICGSLVSLSAGPKVVGNVITNSTIEASVVTGGRIGGLIGLINPVTSARLNSEINQNHVDLNLTVKHKLATTPNQDEAKLELVVGGLIADAQGIIGGSKELDGNIAKTHIEVSTEFIDEFTKANGCESFTLIVGGLIGRLIPASAISINNSVFEGSIKVNSKLEYKEVTQESKTDDKEEEDKIKEIDYYLYVGGLIGNTNGQLKIYKQAVIMSTCEINITRANIEGKTEYNVGNIFGQATGFTNEMLVSNNIFASKEAEFKFNGAEITVNDLLNLNINKESFSDYIKEYLK